MGAIVELKARSRKKDYRAVFLDSIAVPSGALKGELREFFGVYAKYRIDLPKIDRSTKRTKIFRVIEKIIFRGHITRLSPKLESNIAKITKYKVEDQTLGAELILKLRGIYDSGYNDLDITKEMFDGGIRRELGQKSAEQFAYEDILIPTVMKYGRKNVKDIIPQVLFSSLTGEKTDNRRVDFLVTHGVKSMAIEVDDETHRQEVQRDETRDEILIGEGIETVRVNVQELKNGTAKKKIAAKLDTMYQKYENGEIDLRERNFYLGIKLAHMVQAILIKMRESGLEFARVDFLEDMFMGIEPKMARAIVQYAIEDLKELDKNLAEIYDEEREFAELKLDSKGQFVISRNGQEKGGNGTDILVEEISFPKTLKNFSNIGDDFPRIAEVKRGNLEFLLNYVFRYDGFRENQIDGIIRGLNGKDAIVLLPTGSGKSVIYQLLALILPGTGIVVEPLKALMEDQVENLRRQGIDSVVSISGDIRRGEKKEVYNALERNSYSLMYVTPERFQMEDFRELLHKARENGAGFPLCALDEAHCVSEWGHDFRVAYLNLAETARKMLRRGKKKPVILALTGTASDSVLKDMKRDLRISEDEVIRPETFDRPEICYRIMNANSDEKMAELMRILQKEVPREFGEKNREDLMKLRKEKTKAGIVFCVFKTGKTDFGVNAVYMRMRKNGWNEVVKYYGTNEEQTQVKKNARDFKENRASLMVATKAFGMGIDKPNIRYTVHYGIPNSIEAYYQEAGRAGRDGGRAVSYIILSDDAPERNMELINNVLVEDLKKELKKGKKGAKDDVNRLLFLHQKNYDRARVFGDLETILTQIGAIKSGNKRIVAKNHEEFQNWQKILFRLKILNVIDDYTIVDYANNEFKVRVGNFEPERIVRAYGKYVAQYQEGQAKAEMGKIKNRKYDNGRDFIYAAMEVLLDFIENVFESSRRRAIGNMLQLAEDGAKIKDKNKQDEVVRQKILNHLGNTCSNLLNRVMSDREIMLEAASIVSVVMRKDEARLLAETRRMLQAYPEHPGLLLIAGVLGAIDADTEVIAAVNDLRAAMKSAEERYKIKTSKYEKYVARAIGETCRRCVNGVKYKQVVEGVCRGRNEKFIENMMEVLPAEYNTGIGAQVLSKYNLVMISEIRSKIKIDLWTKKN